MAPAGKHMHTARQRCRTWRDTGPSCGSGTRDAAPTPASPGRTAASDACGPVPAPELAPLAFEPAWAPQAGIARTKHPCYHLQIIHVKQTHERPHTFSAAVFKRVQRKLPGLCRWEKQPQKYRQRVITCKCIACRGHIDKLLTFCMEYNASCNRAGVNSVQMLME